ncbi:glycolipid 2-alpha-mannosyltransferase [Xylariales sp. AK1849]|nr:glycolipid 2-alpha-mannosyltransferase [Xylariales sp. AK1849]
MPAHHRLQRLRRRAKHLAPLLWVGLALLIEVVFHVSQFRVPVPSHELDPPFYTSCQEPDTSAPRENAALVMLVRNQELAQAQHSIASIERRFNQWFHYPYVFLNDEPWSDEFISTVRGMTNASTTFEVIPQESWTFPSWLDKDAAQASIDSQGKHGVLYGGMTTYHHMCRFFSGAFYTLEALRKYKYYWRIEPDVDFSCSITYDPFVEMARHKKVYGFTIALWEEKATCPSLFRQVSDWKEVHDIKTTNLWKASISPSRLPWPLRSLVSWMPHRDRHGDSWNLCHYWSNFEIADLDFFRDAPYQNLYEHLEKTAGFYFERWGDAAVHAMAVNMLVEPRNVHHFADFAYRHDWYYQCPANAPGGQLTESDILNRAEPKWAEEVEGGIGCRCDCDGRKTRNQAAYCLNKLREPTSPKRPWSTWALGWVL